MKDIDIVRDLAKEYADIAGEDVQEERRRLWTAHHSLKATRPPVLVSFGMWNVWCREMFGEDTLACEDSFFRAYERHFRMQIFHHSLGDDFICEPWVTCGGATVINEAGAWGVTAEEIGTGVEGGACQIIPPIKTWDDMKKLVTPRHEIDEEATARSRSRLQDAIGDILAVDAARGCAFTGFAGDLSTHLARLRGLEQIMIDMYENPGQLHALLAFMRDGVLAVQDAAEAAGDFSLSVQKNQAMTYAKDLPRPAPNRNGVSRKDLWCHCAAQEFTLISPQMHDEFMLAYQLPIIEKWGLVAYGCCEDLTNKIDMVRKIPNLRTIAVTPVANVARCAEQIGAEYAISWRPNPADMVCCGFDEGRVRRIIGQGLEAAKGCHVHICLKDIETVEGDPTRLSRWVRIVRDVADGCI